MAAGIGSRFGGGIKQLTAFGPNGEIIMDYSIYDAIQAGFDKIVFVIRKDLEDDFKAIIGNRIAQYIDVDYAFQEINDLPEGFSLPEGRKKPWGTGQAILACMNKVKEPFAVINADDYYGKEAFRLVHDYLVNPPSDGKEEDDKIQQICMAGFILGNTLSEHGGVTRGICSVDAGGMLTGVEETKNIVRTPDGAAVEQADGSLLSVDASSLVSMNFWGFFPSFIDELKTGFAEFLQNLSGEKLLGAEYLLPIIIDEKLKKHEADVTVLSTNDKWFGVTYREDVPIVIAAIRELIDQGIYPEKLWQ